ncbi:MAG: peptide chain release factor N(5)-glutamine methyltransferase [Bifidobacteriaceae bacterium]|jgi:release factor glutamine methyltransferase|nr:peptide chain release factor N(5)-glutamine methyltransferase [Bifidobacteriaceae bacterium]
MALKSVDHERLAAGLMGLALGQFRARYLAGGLVLPPGFDQAARRLEGGEPLQYILGRAPFRSLELAIGPGAFIPRPETEVVAGVAIDYLVGLPTESRLAADLGSGAGPIAAALVTEVPGARVWAVERAWAALGQARANLEPLGVTVVGADVARVGQAGGPLADLAGRFSLVVTNPPYLLPDAVLEATVADYEPPAALFGGGVDGLETPLVFLAAAARLLRPGGAVVMEHDPSQAGALREAAGQAGFVDAKTGVDLTGRDRFLQAIRAGDG